MKQIHGGVTAAPGFKAAGVHAGLKDSHQKDFAIILSDSLATAAGVFTQNRVCAAPVTLCRDHIRNQVAKAIVINSKNANACTGHQGLEDAYYTAKLAGESLGVNSNSILVCSTGVIGQQLPMDIIENGIHLAVQMLDGDGSHDAAQAIMTTDIVPKEVAVEAKIDEHSIIIGGMAKGSGMIAPNMATMLSFLTTDVNISPEILQTALQTATRKSFNRITVDSDTSTNDTVLILANGVAENPQITAHHQEFQNALDFVCIELAKMIARDGEGATKLLEIVINNARNENDGTLAARAVAESPLVKTAVFANDANWGRIMMAIGKSGAEFDQSNVEVWIGDCQIVKNGVDAGFDEQKATEQLNKDTANITIDLHSGHTGVTFWTCDYSYDYIKINAEYRT